MKHYKYIAALAVLCLTAACELKNNGGGSPSDNGNQKASWPAYADQELSGKVFGQNWKAVTAVVRPFGADNTQVSVEFLDQNNSEVCKSPRTPSGTYASVVIPADYSEKEYFGDITTGEGNPLVFTTMVGGVRNVIADKTKMRLSSLSETGFVAQVYASGQNDDGSISEINGKISVTDCRKVADFSVWEELAHWYDLETFDGRPVKARYSAVELNTDRFYDRSQRKYLRTYIFPLYSFVGENSDSQYLFGPMEGLGTSTMQEANGVKTFKYSYKGPINMRGTDITLELDMTVVKTSARVTVTYSLNIPSHNEKSAHTFTMK